MIYFSLRIISGNNVHVSKELLSALQIKANQRSITANLQPLTAHIYHVMITVTIDFSKKSFLVLQLFPRNSFINDLELVFLELNTLQNAQTEQTVSFYQKVFFLSVHFLLVVS